MEALTVPDVNGGDATPVRSFSSTHCVAFVTIATVSGVIKGLDTAKRCRADAFLCLEEFILKSGSDYSSGGKDLIVALTEDGPEGTFRSHSGGR